MGSSVILPPPGQPTTGPDPSFVSGSSPALVTFDTQSISPPSSLYIQRNDVMLIEAASTVAGETITFAWRQLMAPVPRGGQPDIKQPSAETIDPRNTNVIVPGGAILTLPNPRTQVFQFIPLSEGYLLSVSAIAALSTIRSQAYVRVLIVRGTAGAFTSASELLADSPTTQHPVSWPYGRQLHSTEGPGFLHSLQATSPLAGNDWQLVAAGRVRVTSFQAQLVASAAVANRNIEVVITDVSSNAYWSASVPVAVTAGQTVQVVGTGTNAPTGVITTILPVVIPPGLTLETGHIIKTVTGNLQAGDQWSAIWFNAEEWMEGV